MQKMTIVDIAKLAGVSPSAVSIVLNNRKGVSDDTRKKVTEIVERLQYTPNPNSRRLLFNKTNNIAVLFRKNISPLDHLFHAELNSVILQECEALGYNLIFTSFSIDNGKVILPKAIKTIDVDGIIFYGDTESSVINSIKKYDIPYIVVDCHQNNFDLLSVRADYAEASYIATKHLIKIGHRKIAYIGNNMLYHHNAQTFSGFKKAIEESNISSLPMNWIQFGATDEKEACKCMKNILTYECLPTAVICSADIYAIGALKCIKDYGLKTPHDISVIGIDDLIISQYVEPSLTTVKIDKIDMGKIAIRLLIKRIEKEEVISTTISSFNLIVRDSIKSIE